MFFNNSKATKIEISHRTIVFTVLFLLSLWLLYQIRGAILLVFISIILTAALNPGVDFFERYKIPRFVSILVFYLAIMGFISSIFAILIPPLIEQTTNLITIAPQLLSRLGIDQIDQSVLMRELSSVPSNVFYFAASAVGSIIVTFTVLVFTFYLLLERKNLKCHLTKAFGSGGEKAAEAFVDKLEQRLGQWVRGQVISMTFVGVLCYLGLWVLGIEFALPLAILTGISEIIPNLGSLASSVPAIIIALATSPSLALGVAALYFVVHQLLSTAILPNIMRQAIGFNPLVTLIALMAGFTLGGIGGAILALPILLTGQVVYETMSQNQSSCSPESTS